MKLNEKGKEFLAAMRQDWRTRYAYVKKDKVVEMDNLGNPVVRAALVSVAHYDPCSIVRSEAVKTCNLLKITYKKKPITLRKMRSLKNTLEAEKINMRDIVLDVFLKAEIPFFPRKTNVSANKALTEKEWNRVHEQFKANYPKVYDLLDGHFICPDDYKYRNVRDKIKNVINSKDKTKINNYIWGVLGFIPRKKLIDFCKKYDIEVEE